MQDWLKTKKLLVLGIIFFNYQWKLTTGLNGGTTTLCIYYYIFFDCKYNHNVELTIYVASRCGHKCISTPLMTPGDVPEINNLHENNKL